MSIRQRLDFCASQKIMKWLQPKIVKLTNQREKKTQKRESKIRESENYSQENSIFSLKNILKLLLTFHSPRLNLQNVYETLPHFMELLNHLNSTDYDYGQTSFKKVKQYSWPRNRFHEVWWKWIRNVQTDNRDFAERNVEESYCWSNHFIILEHIHANASREIYSRREKNKFLIINLSILDCTLTTCCA